MMTSSCRNCGSALKSLEALAQVLSSALLDAKATATVEVASFRRRYPAAPDSLYASLNRADWRTIIQSVLVARIDSAAARMNGFCGRYCHHDYERKHWQDQFAWLLFNELLAHYDASGRPELGHDELTR
ncbi:hypothetical protein QEG98_42040 (plasmid) [Myxococcus sp. MxC21-1]|uniref:hypothetical protein n=1 Tax=Myxococcus sp. MxC21-1 TaxID=3041439 RepID=UPI00292D08D7|nr:hypothetical protein [Myxococcus sp. MxC21-1]WNZ66202.1 hypothetical protein QEG98_42040 [Myxococcus sp. MxC21-1]